METKWASLISYGMTARVLKDFLPLDETLKPTTVHNHTLAVAQRCEEELGEDEEAVVDSCPEDGGPLSPPEGPLSVGLDGGYVRDWDQKQRRFEVIVGKSISTAEPAKCFGFGAELRHQIQERGAHLLLQTRVKTLNKELSSTFRRWYPDFSMENTALAA
jgi:hypothetical protein